MKSRRSSGVLIFAARASRRSRAAAIAFFEPSMSPLRAQALGVADVDEGLALDRAAVGLEDLHRLRAGLVRALGVARVDAHERDEPERAPRGTAARRRGAAARPSPRRPPPRDRAEVHRAGAIDARETLADADPAAPRSPPPPR